MLCCRTSLLALTLAATGAFAVVPMHAAGAADSPAADLAPPAVATVTATPATVDVSTAPADVVVTAQLTDATGVAAASLTLDGGVPVALQLLSGTANDGTWSGVATVPAYAPHGALPAFVEVRDLAGNAATPQVTAVEVLDAAPAAPASATANATGDGVVVTWSAPVPNGGSDVTSYAVSAAPVDGTGTVATTTAADARETTLTGLAYGTRYAVSVAARNAAGTGLPAAADVTTGPPAPTTPGAPQAVAAAPDDKSVLVTWEAPAGDGGTPVTAYDVTAGTTTVRTAATARTATIGSLANGTRYDVTVTAVNALGAGIAATTQATPRTRPGVPGIGTATGGNAAATVRWTAPTSDGGDPVSAYVVVAHPSGKTYVLPPASRSATVAGLTNGVSTTFTVMARNAAGDGLPSPSSNAVIPRLLAKLVVTAKPAAAVTYGTGSVVKAALRTTAGTGLAYHPVDLVAQVRPSTGWRRVAAGRTDAYGNITLRANLPATAALRLHHAADAVAAGDVAVRTVGVAARLGETPNATRLRLGMNVAVSGGVAPAHPAGSAIRLQRLTPTGWVTVASGRMTTTTAYRVTWKPATTGAWYLRVVKPADTDHITALGTAWREQIDPPTTADLARAIRGDSHVTLDTVHSSGVVDAATAARNIADVAAGLPAHRSAYENAPGGYTRVDPRVLQAILGMGARGTVTVSEIAGGSHAPGSAHYSGEAVDVRYVNGVHVAPGTAYWMAVDVCRAYGATHVYDPAYDPFGGHSNHVHCDWS